MMTRKPGDFPDIPPVWALGWMLAAIAAGRLVPPGRFDASLWHVTGLTVSIAGIALLVWASLWFRRKRTPIMPGREPQKLIVEGAFRINRNPIYTGMAFVVLGATMIWGGTAGLVIAAAFPLLITRRFILPEEAALRRSFGAQAESYFARTRRW